MLLTNINARDSVSVIYTSLMRPIVHWYTRSCTIMRITATKSRILIHRNGVVESLGSKLCECVFLSWKC